MAKQIQVNQYGDIDTLKFVDYSPIDPDPDQIQVRNHAIGVNFIDIYYRTGIYTLPNFPSGLGLEGAGEVVAIGSAVKNFKVGDRVAYCSGSLGAYSEIHTLPASHVIHLPDNISFETAAACLLKGLTVQYLLRQTYTLQSDDIILFHAAAGGVGSIACQWAKTLGIKLIGTAGSEEKVSRAKKLGAWQVINYTYEDVVKQVAEFTNGKKCAVVYDSIGQAMWQTSLNCLQPRGLMVSFGNSSGPVTNIELGILAEKGSLYVTRPTLGHYADSPEKRQQMADELFDMIKNQHIQIEVNHRYPLAKVAEAHKALAERQTTGSIILYP